MAVRFRARHARDRSLLRSYSALARVHDLHSAHRVLLRQVRAQLPRYVIHRRLFFRSDNIRKRRVFMVTLALTITEAWVFVIALTEAGKHYVSELRYGYSGLLISIHFIAMIQGLISVLGVWEASPARSMLLQHLRC